MGRFSTTWALMGASWRVLKKDKEILVLPVLSGLALVLVMLSFIIPLLVTGQLWVTESGTPGQVQLSGSAELSETNLAFYAVLFLYYFCSYFIIVFFNAAIVACATLRMEGNDPTVLDGLRAAWARLPVIAGWALVSASVGFILRLIEGRSERLGQIVAGLLGAAFSLVSFFVIPILVIERKGPIVALQDSVGMLKRTWGEQLIGNFSFGLIFFLLALPAGGLILLGVGTGNSSLIVAALGTAFIYWLVLALINTALFSIFQAALYRYSHSGRLPEEFSPALMQQAIRQR